MVKRYSLRISGSGITGDEFVYIDVVPASDYDAAQARIVELEARWEGYMKLAPDNGVERIMQLEEALTRIYGKASACDPSHYNQTMTEIIDIACSVSDRRRKMIPDNPFNNSFVAFVMVALILIALE